MGRLELPALRLIVLVFSCLLPVLRDGWLQLQQRSHMPPAHLDIRDAISRCTANAEPCPEVKPES